MKSAPKFENPPVVETVLGVQFPAIEGFSAVHFGLYWNGIRDGFPGIRDRYPKFEDRPRLDPVRERFPRILLPTPQLQFGPRSLPDRVWFTAESGSELIQLQPDRFHYNWRQREGSYPSYDSNSKVFFKEFDLFCQFCREQEWPIPAPEICEVTYVNHIDPEPGESALEFAGNLFTGLEWATLEGFLSVPESVAFNRVYTIKSEEKPVGRLYAEASIAVRPPVSSASEFILFNLTARVNVDSGSSGLKSSLQLAHDWVVSSFAALTKREIQKNRWKRVK